MSKEQLLPRQCDYLSHEEILALDIPLLDVVDSVEAGFQRSASGLITQKPKLNINPASGHVVEAMIASDMGQDLSVTKWVSVTPDNTARGLPNVQTLVLLSRISDGLPIAIMDGTWITGVRTAACSVAASRYLAKKKPTSVGFIGAGYQAQMHMSMLLEQFPSLSKAAVYPPDRASTERFIEFCTDLGIEVVRAAQPIEAVQHHDLVISSLPPSNQDKFLDPNWLSAGSYLSAVDLGRPWIAESWSKVFAVTATDFIEQSRQWGVDGKMVIPDEFSCEIGDLANGTHPGRTDDQTRTALLFAGAAVADLAVAKLVYEAAKAKSQMNQLVL